MSVLHFSRNNNAKFSDLSSLNMTPLLNIPSVMRYCNNPSPPGSGVGVNTLNIVIINQASVCRYSEASDKRHQARTAIL